MFFKKASTVMRILALNPVLKVDRMLLAKYAQQRYRESKTRVYKIDSFAIAENAKTVKNLRTWARLLANTTRSSNITSYFSVAEWG